MTVSRRNDLIVVSKALGLVLGGFALGVLIPVLICWLWFGRNDAAGGGLILILLLGVFVTAGLTAGIAKAAYTVKAHLSARTIIR